MSTTSVIRKLHFIKCQNIRTGLIIMSYNVSVMNGDCRAALKSINYLPAI